MLLLALVAPRAASAQAAPDSRTDGPSAADIATARELFKEAAALAHEGRWAEALDRYQRSMALRPSPLTRYSIAVAQAHVGQLIEAGENIRVFFQEATPDLQPYVQPAEDLLRSLEPRIARLTIRIPGDPRGARVLLDGRELPAAAVGVERLVNPGQHRIEATVPGHAPFVQRVDLAEGAASTVMVTPPAVTSSAPGETQPGSGGASTTGKVLLGVGASVFAVGGVLGFVGWRKAKDSPTRDGDEADMAKALALVGDIAMGAGLVAAGVGTYLVVSHSADKPASVVVVPWTAPEVAGLGVHGSFW